MIECDIRDGILVVTPQTKRLDASKAPAFKDAIKQQIDQGHHDLVIDFAGVEMVDSSGLGAIVSCLKAVGSRGNVTIASARGPVSRLLNLTRMDKVFAVYTDADEAVAAMKR
jgi:anti-sigma B factor antagonist